MRKGFVYLLRAIRRVSPDRVRLEIIGGTGDRGSRWLFARERAGLDVVLAAGDPFRRTTAPNCSFSRASRTGSVSLPLRRWLVVSPWWSLTSAGPLSGSLPGKWMGRSGRDVDALADVLETAIVRRTDLAEMGRHARQAIDARDMQSALLTPSEL